MEEDRSVPKGRRGCLVEISAAVLAVLVMLAVSTSYQNFSDDFACDGGLGVGFPVSFLCDYGTGGSPISSWGKVDLADFPYLSAEGVMVDALFYGAILWVGWLVRRLLRQNDSYGVRSVVWLVMIAVAFIFGFLSASAMFKADRVNFHDFILGIPSPKPPTSTPVGTPPPPQSTPIPTVGP